MLALSERGRKLLLITLVLAVLLGGSVAVYILLRRTSPTTPTTETPITENPGALPNAGRAPQATDGTIPAGNLPTGEDLRLPGQIPSAQGPAIPRTSILVDTPTSFASAAPAGSNDLRFYNTADGKFYRVNERGETIPLSDKAFYGVERVDWGKATDKAILEFPDGSNIYYNFQEQRQITLPKHWADFTFSSDDTKIVAKSLGNNESNRFLIVSNPDGSEAEAVQELGNNQDKVHTTWTPTSQIIAYAHTGNDLGLDREQIILVGKNQENLPGFVTEGRGLIPSWSPNGSSLLYSVYTSQNGYLPELWVSGGTPDTINSNRRRLNINTWADKCAWQNEELLYCAVPASLEVGAALQRDVLPQGRDQLFRIHLRTGQKTNLGLIEGATNVHSLIVSTDGKSVTMRDTQTGQLLRTRLTP